MRQKERDTMAGYATLYICDPEKNTECPKVGCCYLLSKAEGGICSTTFRREYAREYHDGEPMVYRKIKREERENDVSGSDSQPDLHVQPDLQREGDTAGQ